MKLTPIDIEQQKFRRKMHGYDAREVHHFLEMVAQQMAELTRETFELRGELRRAQRELEELRDREESLKGAMLTAQRAIDELRGQADKEARLTLHEAELKAEKILHNAHGKATEIHEEINELRRQRARFIEELRGVVNTHARLIDVHLTEREVPHDSHVTVLERLRAPAPPPVLEDDDAASATHQ